MCECVKKDPGPFYCEVALTTAPPHCPACLWPADSVVMSEAGLDRFVLRLFKGLEERGNSGLSCLVIYYAVAVGMDALTPEPTVGKMCPQCVLSDRLMLWLY